MAVTEGKALTSNGYGATQDEGVTDLWFPPTGGRYTTKTAAKQTGGRLLQMLGRERRGAASPLHIHQDADETFYVISGELAILVDDQAFKAGPGDFALGPKGVPHAFEVMSERAEFLVTFAPAGVEGPGGFGLDGLFSEVGIPVAPGDTHPDPVEPDPEEFARTAAQYAIEVLGPPPGFD